MRLAVRPTLGLLALTALCLAVSPYEGYYTRGSVAGAVAALGLALAACLLRERAVRVPASLPAGLVALAAAGLAVQCGFRLVFHGEWTAAGVGVAAQLVALRFVAARRTLPPRTAVLAATGLLLAGNGVIWTPLLYGEVAWAIALVRVAAVAGFGLTLLLLRDLDSPPTLPLPHQGGGDQAAGGRRPGLSVKIAALFVAGAVLRCAAVWASPEPVIDVYAWLREAPGHLLQGRDPYAVEYASPYGTDRAHRYEIFRAPEPRPAAYPPLPIIAALPFRAAGLDVRYLNVLAELAAAAALLAAARRRGRPVTGALAAALFLNLPRAPFLIEQAWFEPLLAAALGVGLVLAERGRRAGYVLLGVGLAGKQFGVVLLAPLVRAYGSRWRVLALVAVGAAALVVPFALWHPADFVSIVLTRHVHRPLEFSSITLASAAHDLFGVVLPAGLLWGAAALLIGALAWRTPAGGPTAGLWLGTTLLVFALFHTQGHFNYFYLCAYLWLLGVVGLGGAPAVSTPGATAERTRATRPVRRRAMTSAVS